MAAWLSAHAPWGLEMDGAAIAQTHATSSKADLQHTHVPVKSRGSPEAGTEETHVRGLHSQRGGLPCTPPHPPPPLPATRGTGGARPCPPTAAGGLQTIPSPLWASGHRQLSTAPMAPKPALRAHPSQRAPATRRLASCWATWRPRGTSGRQLLPTAS